MTTERRTRKAPARRKPEERAALAQAIIDGMMLDGLSCRKACEAVNVPIVSFMRWVEADKDLAEQYTRAREVLIENMAYDILEIADAPAGSSETGGVDSATVQKQRLQIDARKWMLSKLAPRKYGDKVTLAGDDDNPVRADISVRFIKPTANG